MAHRGSMQTTTRVVCEAQCPPPPRDLPPATYTWEDKVAIPRNARATVATAARESGGFDADPHDMPKRSGASAVGRAPAHVAADGGSSKGYTGAPGQEPRKPQRVTGGGAPKLAPSARPRIVVQPAPQRAEGYPLPLQPTPNVLLKLLEGAVMSLARPYKERDYVALMSNGARQIRSRRDIQEWPVTEDAVSSRRPFLWRHCARGPGHRCSRPRQMAGSGGRICYLVGEGSGSHLVHSRPASSSTGPQPRGPRGGG